MRTFIRIILIGFSPLILWGCTTFKIMDLGYSPGKVLPILSSGIKVAVIPFEDITWNGQENPNWVVEKRRVRSS